MIWEREGSEERARVRRGEGKKGVVFKEREGEGGERVKLTGNKFK